MAVTSLWTPMVAVAVAGVGGTVEVVVDSCRALRDFRHHLGVSNPPPAEGGE